jgi:3-oxoacyl-[acyl-carrier protein] reductase
MSEELKGTVAVITGASSGIGTAMAHRFAAEGVRTVLAARRVERLKTLRETIVSHGGEAIVFPLDVTDPDSVERLVETTLNRFGRIDVMVNNAGNAVAKPLLETTVQEIDSQIDVNLKGVCYGSRAVLRPMIDQREGHIINIGSICSFRHFPNYATYVAAKFAVLGFSRSLYEEVREFGIRVHTLCPAAVNTEWADVAGAELPWPREDRLQPEDIAELAVTCLKMPKRVQLESIVAWPVCESTV